MSSREQNIPLNNKTTLKVGGVARYYAEAPSSESLLEHVSFAQSERLPIYVLGGGSNVLIPDAGLEGMVLHITVPGKTYTEDGDTVYFTCGAGEMLDECIQTTIDNNWWGLENLSGIPGTIGGVPIQNVGAYGVEVKDCIESVTVFDMRTGTSRDVTNDECMFRYRDSIFKHETGKSFIVTQVTFKLTKLRAPKLMYGDLASLRDREDICTLHDIREHILKIRSAKFPDWHAVGTAGSFFKNPIIPNEHAQKLARQYPKMPMYPVGDAHMKISLGWVLDHVCNVRGYREGHVSLYEKQALVLVCDIGGTAHDIKTFAQHISEKVFNKTKIQIEYEVCFF